MNLGSYSAKCLDMTNPVVYNKIFGPIIQMPYLLANEWYTNASLYPLALMMTVFVLSTSLISTVLYVWTREKADSKDTDLNNDRQVNTFLPSIETQFLWFNWSNSIIFALLSNCGWLSKTFVLAELHNGLEVFMSMNFMLQHCSPNSRMSKILKNNILNKFLLGVILGLALFQLVVFDLVLAANVKAVGGVGDIILLFTAGYDIYVLCKPSREGKLTIEWSKTLFMRLGCVAHAVTVMFTFSTCLLRDVQLVGMILGTVFMNIFGLLYYTLNYIESRRENERMDEELSSLPTSSP